MVFGRQAETAAKYLKKGASAMIEGRMQTRSWDDKATGEKKYRTEVIADRVQFGPRAGGAPVGGASAPAGGASSSGPAKAAPASKEENLDTIEYPQEEINAEDIPF